MNKPMTLIALTAFLLSCGGEPKKTTTGPPDDNNNTARLAVSSDELFLSGIPDLDKLVISNRGRQQLIYEITDFPEWLEVSKLNGQVQWGPDTVGFILKMAQVSEEKEYTGQIKIQSNGGDATVQVVYRNLPPAFSVWLPVLQFSRDYLTTTLLMTNEGGRSIEWKTVSQPEWIDMSPDSGTVYAQPGQVYVEVDLSKLTYGQYTGQIEIESSAGNATVTANLIYERHMEVLPGDSAADVALGDTYATMRSVHGDATSNEILDVPDKMVQLMAKYPAKGLIFKFVPGTTIMASYDTKKINSIYMFAPYDALTDKNIVIGSSHSEVIAAYGDPQEVLAAKHILVYSSGIAFYFDPSMQTVTGMAVFAERTDFSPW